MMGSVLPCLGQSMTVSLNYIGKWSNSIMSERTRITSTVSRIERRMPRDSLAEEGLLQALRLPSLPTPKPGCQVELWIALGLMKTNV
jgi:hypothetical protein